MIDGTPQEQDAAEKSAEHAGTSTIAHFDTLGRPFLTIADNGTDENGRLVPAGNYLLRFSRGDQLQTVKVLLLPPQ